MDLFICSVDTSPPTHTQPCTTVFLAVHRCLMALALSKIIIWLKHTPGTLEI